MRSTSSIARLHVQGRTQRSHSHYSIRSRALTFQIGAMAYRPESAIVVSLSSNLLLRLQQASSLLLSLMFGERHAPTQTSHRRVAGAILSAWRQRRPPSLPTGSPPAPAARDI